MSIDKLSLKGHILTPTRRLAGHCLKQIAKKRGLSSSIAVHSLADWIKECWDQYEMEGTVTELLLTSTQSLLACEQIIVQSSVGALLVDPYQTAKRAYSAWTILHQWRSLDLLEREYDHIDYQAFVEWMKIYQHDLAQHHYIDEAMLPQAVLEQLIARKPETLIFYGFEEKTPFLAHFVESLTEYGWSILWELPEKVMPRQCYRSAFTEQSQERMAAVQFAKTQYEKGKKNIAIVVPDLATERQHLEKQLRDVFDPLTIAAPWVEIDPHFNISAAIPFVRYPIVCSALDILRGNVLSYTKTTEKSYTAWAEHFRHTLTEQQWPGQVALTSIEYQSMVRFDVLLQEFSECDRVLPPCRYFVALSRLEKLASYIPFQPENRNAPIQVLGILEAAGQTFDALWIMGMQNEAWPPPAQHNPFIELEAQRQRGMPHASAEREMHYALSMTNRFKESAHEVVFSYATQNKERKWEVSELIRNLPLHENQKISKEKTYAPISLDDIEDKPVPLVNAKKETYPTRALELQSSCPFRAFAEYRLGVKSVSEKTQWLTPGDQGVILHKILEKWWKKYTQQHVKAMAEQAREENIRVFIEESLNEYSLAASYKTAEFVRLMIILKDYMNLEANRDFFRVMNTEYRKIYTLGEMILTLRCDRMDEDESGAQYIIDYKTGKFMQSSLQLPLYALAYETPQLSGVRVIQLRLEGCEYIDPYEDKDFHLLSQAWRTELTMLARSFVAGEANVHPKNAAVCLYCHLQPLCRIYEQEAMNDH